MIDGMSLEEPREEDHKAVYSLTNRHESAIDPKDDLTLNPYNINTTRLSPLNPSSLHTIELFSTARSTTHHSNIVNYTRTQNQYLLSKHITYQNAVLRLLRLSICTYLSATILPQLCT